MKQDIENIIKKNLEEINNDHWINAIKRASDFNEKQYDLVLNRIFDKTPSLITDEVLKVVIRKIEEIETFEPEDYFVDGGDMEYASRRLAVDNSRRWGEIKIKTDILQLLSNLSTNKENEIEEIPLFNGTMDKLNKLSVIKENENNENTKI